jgi:hypothetical protein
LGIWAVEPDKTHFDQTYDFAYLRPWAPALARSSEQEYELNTRWERTNDETCRKYCDKIKDYPVRWRLIWEDTRYADGRVPPEEAEYLIYRDPAQAAAGGAAPGARLRCEGGQPCPQSGLWTTPSGGGVRRRFERGEAMPVLGSAWGVTVWQLDGAE